ncbi:UNVERIFIED_CONTAM: hypothetical protein Sradi_0573100 [Sesamum radiatum]|uniref:Uncharacterized protein n=1 Tax=Sesamum radiatum TaxID=300843 RepID=A0AAW2VK72_SESRA
MSSTAMSIPPSFTTVNSTIINHRLVPPLVRPSARFLPMSLFVKSHLLPLCSANCSHTDVLSRRYSAVPFDKYRRLMLILLIFCSWIDFKSVCVRILTRLKRYGIAGILSYGLLNTAYYLTTFLVVWFYVTPAPGRMGYLAAVERFLKVMAMVWAGSQVTKLIRAGGALALAPFVDRGLSWFTAKFGFESQGKAFMAIAGLCFGLAFLMFVIVTLLSA